MKVLLLNTADTRGGAARACFRLMEMLLLNGIEANMLSLEGDDSHPNLSHLGVAAWKKFYHTRFDKYYFRLNGIHPRSLFSTGKSGLTLHTHPLVKNADIIHLHWINRGFLSLHELQALQATGKKIVWTMHDMWPFTGGCHYNMDCFRFTDHCGACPCISSSDENDISQKILRKKQSVYDLQKISFITPSLWLKQEALKSSLLKNASIKVLGNPINTQLFIPGTKKMLRGKMGIHPEKKVILFSADNPQDERKGLNYLLRAMQALSKQFASLSEKIELLILGNTKPEMMREFPFKVHSTGLIRNEQDLANAYRVADIYAIPSLQDNLPNTLAEALSSGLPSVGFNTCGIPEFIKHRENGYLAVLKSEEDFAEGIAWVLEDDARLESLGIHARNIAESSLAYSILSSSFIRFYSDLLNKPGV